MMYVTTMMTKLSMDGGSTMWVSTRGCSCPVPLQQVAAALHNFTLSSTALHNFKLSSTALYNCYVPQSALHNFTLSSTVPQLKGDCALSAILLSTDALRCTAWIRTDIFCTALIYAALFRNCSSLHCCCTMLGPQLGGPGQIVTSLPIPFLVCGSRKIQIES